MAKIEVPGVGVQIGDRLEDEQLVVGIAHDVKTDEYWHITLSVAATFDGPTTGTRTVEGTEMVMVDRPDKGREAP